MRWRWVAAVVLVGCEGSYEPTIVVLREDTGAAREDATVDTASSDVGEDVATDSTEPDTWAPDTWAPDTWAPDTWAPDTWAPDTEAPDTAMPPPDTAPADTGTPDTAPKPDTVWFPLAGDTSMGPDGRAFLGDGAKSIGTRALPTVTFYAAFTADLVFDTSGLTCRTEVRFSVNGSKGNGATAAVVLDPGNTKKAVSGVVPTGTALPQAPVTITAWRTSSYGTGCGPLWLAPSAVRIFPTNP